MARIQKVDAANPNEAILGQAVKLLKKGEVVVCPTDTGYAFAANALDVRAITRVFALKGRSFSNPIHIAVTSIGEAEKYAVVNEEARYLAEHYLPGGLTLVMTKKETVPSMLVAGMDTIGVRIPDNKIILELVQQTGFPLTTTSANVSGKPGTYAVEEITEQLGDDIDDVAMILDGGKIKTREVSTIVDVSVRPPQLIRQGLVSWLEIRDGLKRFDKPEESDTGT
ncbi:MAG: L-threonylcarbamoyladenylate synthase [Dehalococcoidales bacterium]|nr:L-threonylcarbamoyladenylate synthase [Dehalococcoidales bacterium]